MLASTVSTLFSSSRARSSLAKKPFSPLPSSAEPATHTLSPLTAIPCPSVAPIPVTAEASSWPAQEPNACTQPRPSRPSSVLALPRTKTFSGPTANAAALGIAPGPVHAPQTGEHTPSTSSLPLGHSEPQVSSSQPPEPPPGPAPP